MITTAERNTEYRRYIKKNNVTCTCGYPAECAEQGLDFNGHSPDCALELAWDHINAVLDDEDGE